MNALTIAPLPSGDLDTTDLFCGAGGSGLGAHAAGVQLEQTAQLGNAVTPSASEWLYNQCAKVLGRAA
jgi:site-specific DNA-cytosine methylase